MKFNLPDFLKEAVDAGVKVTMERDAKYGVRFDMNLMAKSHMHLVQENGVWYALMRYDEVHMVEDANDLKRLAKHGMHGREFISADWAEFMMTDEERKARKFAQDALRKLSPEEQRAVQGYFVK
jgi:hypothetical protein